LCNEAVELAQGVYMMRENPLDRIALEFICALGLNPVLFVEAARQLGCGRVGMGLAPIATCDGVDANWSLRENAGLRKDLAAAMRAHDVKISLGEGFIAMPHVDMVTAAVPDLEILAELGATRVNLISIDSDFDRAVDQCGRFVEAATSFGMSTTLEFMPGLPLTSDIASAKRLISAVAADDFRLLLDAMHVFRSGAGTSDIAALDPDAIGYVQLCDVPNNPSLGYAEEAQFERLAPGEGDLPLQAFLDALPREIPIGLELPMRSKAEAGLGIIERLQGPVDETRYLLARESLNL
jgi:sugar phosphate isomerase/epimerase